MDAPDSMREFLRYHRQMFTVMLAVCLAVAAALFVAMRPDYSRALGFAAGAAAQLLKFAILDVAVIRKIAVEKKDAAATQLKVMVLSLILFGAAVMLVHTMHGNIWAMAAGIFLPRIILLADTYIRPNPFGEASSGGTPASGTEDRVE